jgi:hypothetical protein
MFAFLPQDKLKHLALVSNPMVITHEFSHEIFAYAAMEKCTEISLNMECIIIQMFVKDR